MEIKLENVILYSMNAGMPTVLLLDGRQYVLREADETVVVDKTAELQEMMKKRGRPKKEDAVNRGDVVARVGTILIYRKPLDEMLELKEQDRMVPLNMASVLRKYYPDVKSSTVAVYRSGYQNFINKSKNVDIRLNAPVLEHETVTKKDRERILQVIADANSRTIYPEFEGILRNLDMTEYKLKLALRKMMDESVVETIDVDGKIAYRLVAKGNL
jgi:hypothetical protein